MKGISIGKRLRLLVNGVDDALVPVADVDRHQLAVEVDEAFPFRRPEINPFRFRNGNRINFRLRRPLEQRVLLGEINNFLAGHRGSGKSCGHEFLLFRVRDSSQIIW